MAVEKAVLGVVVERFDIEDRHHLGEVGHVRLDQRRGRKDRLAPEAPLLVLLGVAGGPPEALGELSRETVGAAGAQRRRLALWIDPPDRFVAELPLLSQL